MSSFFWEVKLHTKSLGTELRPFHIWRAWAGTASRLVTSIVLHLHYPHSHSPNHSKWDQSNFLFRILYKCLFFGVVFGESLTVYGRTFSVVFPPLALSLSCKAGHGLRERVVPSVPSAGPGPKKKFSKWLITGYFWGNWGREMGLVKHLNPRGRLFSCCFKYFWTFQIFYNEQK